MSVIEVYEIAESLINSNNLSDIKYAKSVASICVNSSDEYTRALGIELLGLILDKESIETLIGIDVNETSYVEDLCLIEALRLINSCIARNKIIELIEDGAKCRVVTIAACDSLYANWKDLNTPQIHRLQQIYIKESDEIVVLILAGLLFLTTKKQVYFDVVLDKTKSTDPEVAEEAVSCHKDVMSFL